MLLIQWDRRCSTCLFLAFSLHKNCIRTASIIGSIAAAIECEKNGNIPVKVDEVIEKIKKIKL